MEQQASVSKRRGIPLRRAADRPLRSSSRASGRAAQPDAPAAAVAPAPAGFAAGGLPYSESLEHFSRLVHERADGDASAALGAPADTTWTKRAAQGEDDSKDDMAGGGAPPLGSSPLTGKVGEPALGPLDCVPMLAFPKTHHAHKVVIALDNDECIGSWADLSMLYTLFVQVLRIPPPVALFARLLTDTGCARPGLRQLYDTLLALKAEGLVHGVYMCTAARDTMGWVSFLRGVLEEWYGQPVYDGMVEGSMILDWHAAHGTVGVDPLTGCYVKDMNQVRSVAGVGPDTPVIALDDHPENIRNGEAVHIFPYYVAVNLVEVARVFVAEWNYNLEATYGRGMQHNWHQYLSNPSRYTVAWRDNALAAGADKVQGMVRGLHAARLPQ